MTAPNPQSSTAQIIGQVLNSVLRGAAIVFLALALYVALTNWDGGGDVWALRYTILAIALYLAGRGLRSMLSRID